ncbi:MAG TPA: hypothetical protein VMT15_03320 [Bryobacteraceae bacterium]|nr:hypothetical protein [Bryobacteraceae bacterium]
MKKYFLGGCAAVAFSALILSADPSSVNPSLWSGLRYRMIGPLRGGRVTTVTGVPSEPRTFYMGSTGGGVWKTTDAGHSWSNISDGFFQVASMGAVEVSQSDPNIVFAGTGSSKIRSNVSIGHGIYKSTDAGKTWSFSGLRDVGQISTIRIHPANPQIAYVAALGNPFIPNGDRGVYRTNDGGKTWKKVLYLNDAIGAADLELQPGDPNVVFACMWFGQRKPWTILSGAKEGGIYKSTDGGETWNKLAGGLPHELFGRANVAISNSKPNRIYALIEALPGSGLYRSEDAGATWTLVNGAGNLTTRPFYYDTLGVDPNNSDIVYVGNEGWYKSTDGGKTFRTAQVPHGDNHDVWINPNNSDYMIQSNDGGANVSLDGGRTWSTQTNQPTAEIYQVAVDNQYPYRVYGAQQDNTTVIAPSLPLGDGEQFRIGPGCETGPIIPDFSNPEIVYGSCKGQFSRRNMTTTNEQRYWIGAESLYGNGGETLTYRFQRVSPMEVSPHDPRVVYYGSQYVHRTRDGGKTWTRLSPDLTLNPPGTQDASGGPITRDATGEEVYSTLYSIRESPVQKGLIWTGSNDGLVFVSRNDGESWSNVTPPNLAQGGRVQNIEPSPHRPGTAYVALYRYLLGDFAPYIYRTGDYGKTWTLLTDGHNGIAADEPTRVVREDPDRPGLLYAGTEFGIYISFDNGGHWQSFQLNLPVTPVTDIKVAHKDLVLSTQGRSFWILDNLTPLHQLKDFTGSQPVLFAPRQAVRTPGAQALEGLTRTETIRYPQTGAQIDYYLQSAAAEVTLEILDESGKLIRKFSSKATAPAPVAGEDEMGFGGGGRGRGAVVPPDAMPGMHRFTWDLRYPGPWQSARNPEGPNGPVAVPGKYQVRITAGSFTATQPFTVIEDPRITKDGVTQADLQEQFDHNMRVRELVSDMNKMVARIRSAPKSPQLDAFASHIVTPTIRYSKPELQTHIQYLYQLTNGADQKPGRDAVERYEVLRKELDGRLAELSKLLGN